MKWSRKLSIIVGYSVPFVYAYKTRMGKSLSGLLKWLCEFLMPTFGLYYFAIGDGRVDVVGYALMTTLVYTLYEWGYFWNDTVTVRKETNPTLRLSAEMYRLAYQNRYVVTVVRLVFAMMLTWWIFYQSGGEFGGRIALCAAWMLPLVYAFHNTFRGTWSHLSHLLLLFLRYVSAALLPLLVWSWWIPLLAFLVYPLPNMMEMLARGKFGLSYPITRLYLPKYENRYRFRVCYYVLFSLVLWFLYLINRFSIGYCLLPTLLLVYQLFFYVIKGFKYEHRT